MIRADSGKPLQYLKGVGPARAACFEHLGIRTVRDLLLTPPREWDDRSAIRRIAQVGDGERGSVAGTVVANELARSRRGEPYARVFLEDGSGRLTLLGFRGRARSLARALPRGVTAVVFGTFQRGAGGLEASDYEYEVLTGDEADLIHTNRIVPVYALTEGLSGRVYRRLVRQALDSSGTIPDDLPDSLRARHRLTGLPGALAALHFPDSFESRDAARRRLAFEEILLLELAMMFRRRARGSKGYTYEIRRHLLTPFREHLGFEFTGAQTRVIHEIFNDLQAPAPMNRLLQGDVGSGKTVVALSALLLAAENGGQGALMAPTEILAEQHYLSWKSWLSGLPVRVDLLIGSLPAAEKTAVHHRLASGETQIVVGTHALIEEAVRFRSLRLIVADEQHRFGVAQRLILQEKGGRPLDVLVMTATPIPRTLALTAYGDLDVSILDEMPPGRLPVTTLRAGEADAYSAVRAAVRDGRQAYIVFPLVEESDKVELKAATDMAEQLQTRVFPDLRLGLLHGQMPGPEKERAMIGFARGAIQVLVCTTVIEVGIDVPNATVMVIAHADRFGLATLHQLRGRVGRGGHASTCFLLGDPKTDDARRRMDIMLETGDGFRIADEDLKIRGPGEFLGTAQHGLPPLRFADLIRDRELIGEVREAAAGMLGEDAGLRAPEHAALRARMLALYGRTLSLGEVV